ncbi:MAG: FAD-dependent oxidoreductase [Anaerolineae bacterium]
MAQVQQQYDVCILGAGLAGLTYAREVALQGTRVLVLEREGCVGGLARTLKFDDYRFDIGGHRFHSPWPEVTAYVQALLGPDLLTVPRRSHIRLNGRLVDYPLQFPNALLALGPAMAARVSASYLKAALTLNGRHPDVSFEQWVVRRYGRALYDIYFRPYTEKVWGLPCAELSAAWAAERIQLPNLLAAVKGSLLKAGARPATLVSRFLYPRQGIGMLPERLAREAEESGRAHVLCGCTPQALEETPGGWDVLFVRDGTIQRVQATRVVSTIPLPALWALLPRQGELPPALDASLSYRGLVCVFVALDLPCVSDDTWTYFPDAQIRFGRIHEPRNWSPEMAPAGRTSLCIEVSSSEGDEAWCRQDSELVDEVTSDLERLQVVPRKAVRDAWLLRVPAAYPCYRVGYAEGLARATAYLKGRWPHLHLLGRTGTFQYLNMDAVIEQAVSLAQVQCQRASALVCKS